MCEYGCALWSGSGGICGVSISSAECNAKCRAQDWTWNYVDCLQQYAASGEQSCSTVQQAQCYDAFSLVPATDDTVQEAGYSSSFVTTVAVTSSVASLLVGVLATMFVYRFLLKPQPSDIYSRGTGSDYGVLLAAEEAGTPSRSVQ